MKKIFTLILAVVFSTLIQAQPTLNGNDILYSADDNYSVHAGTQSGLGGGAAGNGVTWDFSTITCPTVQTMSLLPTTSSPVPYSFPTANLVIRDSNGDLYLYEYTGNSSWQRLGYHQVSTSFTTPFTNSEQIMAFPISYNDLQTDSFSGSGVLSGITILRSGNVTTEYDGFGTLILPYGTVSNVVRIHSSEVYSDEYVSYGMQIDYVSDVYMFYRQGINYPLLSISSITTSTGGTTQYASYLDPSHVGISEQGNLAGFSLYPNPATDFVMAEFESDAAGTAEIKITDMSGKLISSSQSMIESAGPQSIRIDVSTFISGLYLVSVSNGDRTSYIKLNIQ